MLCNGSPEVIKRHPEVRRIYLGDIDGWRRRVGAAPRRRICVRPIPRRRDDLSAPVRRDSPLGKQTMPRSVFPGVVRRPHRRFPATAREPRSTSSRRSSGPSARRGPSTPSGPSWISASARTTRLRPPSVRARMAEEIHRPETAATPTTASLEFKEAVVRFMRAQFRRGARRRPRSEPLHRIEDGARHAAGLLHQPRRRDLDDRARLSRGGNPHAVLRRQRPQAPLARRERLPARLASPSPPRSCSVPNCWSSTIPTAPPAEWQRGRSTSRWWSSPRSHRIVVVQDAAHVLLTYAGDAVQFPQRARSPRSRRRNPFAVEGFRHDRLALGLGLRARADRAGFCGCQGQLRFGPVHGDPESGRDGLGRRFDPRTRSAESIAGGWRSSWSC